MKHFKCEKKVQAIYIYTYIRGGKMCNLQKSSLEVVKCANVRNQFQLCKMCKKNSISKFAKN